MDKIKILYFVDTLEVGGIQTMLLNWIKCLDKGKYQIEILTLDYNSKNNLEKQMKDQGVKIHKLFGINLSSIMNFAKYYVELKKFFQKNNDYKIVHIHASSKNYLVLKMAKKYGIPIRISHSHSTDFVTDNKLKKIIGNFFKNKLKKYSTDFLACSTLAGVWLFGDKIVNSEKFKVINNSIDYSRFSFDDTIRNRVRNELGILEHEIVLGHVGRMAKVKNHEFLLDVFYEYNQKNPNSKLLLVGEGELMNNIIQKISSLKLENNVILTGNRNDVNELMQGMDFFVMPSLYEGLPMVLVEAQASGLFCLVSDTVSREAKLSDSFEFYSIRTSAKKWANFLINQKNERVDNFENLKRSGFLIENTIEILEKIYLR